MISKGPPAGEAKGAAARDCPRSPRLGRPGSGAQRLTVRVSHSCLASLEVVEFFDDFFDDALEFAHLDLEAREGFLFRDGVVVDGVGANVDVEIDQAFVLCSLVFWYGCGCPGRGSVGRRDKRERSRGD